MFTCSPHLIQVRTKYKYLNDALIILSVPKWSHTINFRHSLVEIKDRCLVPPSHLSPSGILSWCTAVSVTLFLFCASCNSSVPCNRNTRFSRTFTINHCDVLNAVNRSIPIYISHTLESLSARASGIKTSRVISHRGGRSHNRSCDSGSRWLSSR